MPRPDTDRRGRVPTAGARRRVLLRCLFGLALAIPAAAHSISLSQLLRLPLEELMKLKICSALSLSHPKAAPSWALPSPSGRIVS